MNTLKLKLTALLTILLAAGGINAQGDAKARELLDEVYEKIEGYRNISLEFKNVLENTQADVRDEFKGEMTVEGDLYIVNVKGVEYLFDGENGYAIFSDNKEVMVYSSDETEDFVTPSSMLTFFKEGHTAKWDILQNIQGRKIQYIKLIPNDPNSDMKDILLGVDVSTKHIYRVIRSAKDQTRTTITVQSFKVNQTMPSNIFTFDRGKYESEGYYIDE